MSIFRSSRILPPGCAAGQGFWMHHVILPSSIGGYTNGYMVKKLGLRKTIRGYRDHVAASLKQLGYEQLAATVIFREQDPLMVIFRA